MSDKGDFCLLELKPPGTAPIIPVPAASQLKKVD
jgi:hypothetical protein